MHHLMIDIEGTELNPEDKDLLSHPNVGGIILFSRNYEHINQLKNLTREIKSLKNPSLLISVDHEGGRVQRFRKGFTELPSMRELGQENSLEKIEKIGKIMGDELKAVGIDLSFAPVLDIDYGMSEIIGDRSFGSDPKKISLCAAALLRGMHHAGLLAVGKHFPGHGFVKADSHINIPIDSRTLEEIIEKDCVPFKYLIEEGLDGIMPAHVIYEKIDDKPAGFSHFWLQTILRHELNFHGKIFSDDLCMEGATPMGNIIERAQKAYTAGCDMLLICNNRNAAIEVINHDFN